MDIIPLRYAQLYGLWGIQHHRQIYRVSEYYLYN